tara:strand:+ start:1124 stop:2770 length:1647 start_codon:yes stop_codon:yes gene_type:complete
MNLGEMRAAMFAQADWGPKTSTEAKNRANEFINRAYNLLALEAPFLFFEDELHIATQKDEVPTLSTDLVNVENSDPWVLSAALAPGTTDALVWPTDRSWDGRWIELKDSNGTYHRHQIRTVWTEPAGGGASAEYRMTLFTPYNGVMNAAVPTTSMTYRIYTPHYSLPADVISVNSMRLYQENEGWPLDIMGQMEAEEKRIADANRNVSAGRPRVAYRRKHWAMPAPAEDPEQLTLEAEQNVTTFNWLGPEPAGTFQYVYTYCWGRRDDQHWRHNPGLDKSTIATTLAWCNPSSGTKLALYNTDDTLYTGLSNLGDRARYSPLWESAPSPASEVITAKTNGLGIYLKFPDLEKMQGFGYSTQAQRYRRSGWRIRIYRKRLTSTAESGFTGFGDRDVEDSSAYYLMMEVPGWCTEIIDNGAITPDYGTRLKTVHGYQNIALYPRPDARYELDVRCVRRPAPLVHDQDAPKVHPEAVELVLQRALTFLYEAQGNKGMSGIAFSRYERDLQTLSKRYGDLRTSARANYRKVARANPNNRSARSWRQWWTTST